MDLKEKLLKLVEEKSFEEKTEWGLSRMILLDDVIDIVEGLLGDKK